MRIYEAWFTEELSQGCITRKQYIILKKRFVVVVQHTMLSKSSRCLCSLSNVVGRRSTQFFRRVQNYIAVSPAWSVFRTVGSPIWWLISCRSKTSKATGESYLRLYMSKNSRESAREITRHTKRTTYTLDRILLLTMSQN